MSVLKLESVEVNRNLSGKCVEKTAAADDKICRES